MACGKHVYHYTPSPSLSRLGEDNAKFLLAKQETYWMLYHNSGIDWCRRRAGPFRGRSQLWKVPSINKTCRKQLHCADVSKSTWWYFTRFIRPLICYNNYWVPRQQQGIIVSDASVWGQFLMLHRDTACFRMPISALPAYHSPFAPLWLVVVFSFLIKTLPVLLEMTWIQTSRTQQPL